MIGILCYNQSTLTIFARPWTNNNIHTRDNDVQYNEGDDRKKMFTLLNLIGLIRGFTNRLSAMRNASLDYDDVSTSTDNATTTRSNTIVNI